MKRPELLAPLAIERRYQSELNKLMIEIGNIIEEDVIAHLPYVLSTKVDEERMDDIASKLAALFLLARGKISGLIALYGTRFIIQNIASLINAFNIKQFQKSIKYGIGEFPLSPNVNQIKGSGRAISGGARMTKTQFNYFVKAANPEQIMAAINSGKAPFGAGPSSIKSPNSPETIETKAKVSNLLKAQLGIDPLAGNPKLAEQMNMWVVNNVNLISNTTETFVNQAEQVVMDGARRGLRHEVLAKEIMAGTDLEPGRFKKLQTRASLIARDQTNKLNGTLNRVRQEESGIEDYTWRDVGDSRVRHEHRKLDGKVFSWSKGAPSLGGLNPGDDYNCRCWADPVIDLNKILGEY